MKSKIKVYIPNPCQENWFEMIPLEKGRFCASCKQNVYDFTNLSDREIVESYTKTGNLCGRFYQSQLDRELIIPKEKKRVWLATVSTVFSFLGLGTHQNIAQEKPQTEQNQKSNKTDNSSNLEEVEISGVVIDENSNPLSNISIRIAGHKVQKTDINGAFCITASNCNKVYFFDENDEYADTFYKVDGTKSNIQIVCEKNIQKYTRQTVLAGAVCIVTTKKRTFFGRIFHTIGSWFK